MSTGERSFRPDIQGLRALAVGVVLVYHVWPSWLSGGYVGVDVFFVISGFLITGHLLAEQHPTPRGLLVFWSRRLRRLLPAALVVLVVSLVAVVLVLPDLYWGQHAREALAATFYVENLVLAADAVDYLREGGPSSAMQHYWSLSVEEQFYLVWPVLLLVAAVVATRRRRSRRALSAAVVAVVTVLSLAVSVRLVDSSPSAAYFSTVGRVWEFGAGALLAVLATSWPAAGWSTARHAVVLRRLVAWAGLLAVVGVSFAYSETTSFPGWAAVVPVAGAAAVIGTHDPTDRLSPGRLLAVRPLRFLGDISYSLYLWHWPVVVVASVLAGHELGVRTGVAVVALSVGLAWLTKRHVEDRFRVPARHAPLRSTYRRAVAGMAAVALVAGALFGLTQTRVAAAQRALTAAVAKDDACFGAGSLSRDTPCRTPRPGPVVPAPLIAQQDRTRLYEDECWEDPPFAGTASCSYGDPDAPVSIALVGNSHAGQWFAAVEAIAAERGARVTTFVAAGCTVTAATLTWDTQEQADGCRDWGRRVVAETTSDRYDLVVTSEIATRIVAGGSSADREKDLAAGYTPVLREWEAHGKRVLVIRDSPRVPAEFGTGPECVSAHPDAPSACRGERRRWVRPDALATAARALGSERVGVVDLTSHFCTSTCGATVGGVLLYYDNHHLTDTYVRTLVPYLRPALLAAVDTAAAEAAEAPSAR